MLTGKKIMRISTAVLLILVMVFMVQSEVPVSASSLSSLQKKQSQLKKQQAKVSQELKNLKNDKAKKTEYKNALNTQITTVQAQIDNLTDQISGLDADITDKESKIADKQKDIDKNYSQLKDRLRAMYLTGEASNLEIVLNAKNIMDLADKTELIKAITKYDTDLINTLKSEVESVKSEKAEIEKNKASVTAAKTECDQKQSELTSLVNETNKVIAELSQDESAKQSESNQIAAERKKADSAIDTWYKKYYEDLAKQKSSGGGGAGSSGGGAGSGGYISKGNFTWPVPSCTTISSGYGWRNIGNGQEFHKGVDISRSGIYGAAIVAADSGRVIQSNFGQYGSGYGGYGNVVAIDHGGGYSTRYGHCSSLVVSTGQIVQKGQVIAYVGSSGQSTGAHLHFEIRINGVTQNPMNWFSK